MNKKQFQEQMEKTAQLNQKRMEVCGGDFHEYIERYNRHTLQVSLTDEQVNKQFWEGTEITFFNEDNAISHLSLVNDFLELLTKEENRSWGTYSQGEASTERILDFVRKRVSNPKGHKSNGDNLVPLTEIAENLKQELEEENA